MKNKKFKLYYLSAILISLLISIYPVYMGVSVVWDMANNGEVKASNYPKYVIPYAPMALAVILGVIIMPFAFKFAKKYALLLSSAISLGIFLASELLLESKVIVTESVATTLESWQLYMCYVPPETFETRTWKPIDVLIGNYSPTFKLHFYMIAIVLILALLNSFYGFGKLMNGGTRKKLKHLVLQTVLAVMFLGMCIWACFTAFYRTGELTVAPLSAVLMGTFFVLLGVTTGIYTGSFTVGKKHLFSLILPAFAASSTTLLMYIGEMFLLSRHLYILGNGFLFKSIPYIVLAPIDIIIILLAGAITFYLNKRINKSAEISE